MLNFNGEVAEVFLVCQVSKIDLRKSGSQVFRQRAYRHDTGTAEDDSYGCGICGGLYSLRIGGR